VTLLDLYDREVRSSFADRLPAGWTADADGPLVRCVTGRRGFAMLTGPIEDVEDLEPLVDRTIDHYAGLGLAFEWKTFDHDPPALRDLLGRAGAEAEPHEALVLGEAAAIADAAPPAGVTVRTTTARADLERVAALESEVWGEDWSWLADDLAARLTGAEPIEVFLAEADDRVVSAAWLVPLPGTSVAGLWGGSTLAAYRGRGVYRALVSARARRAVELGHPYLQVDASDDSRPILERLGLQVVGGTQPYVFTAA
jgi:GNAT superfamily N-acetyltransferase